MSGERRWTVDDVTYLPSLVWGDRDGFLYTADLAVHPLDAAEAHAALVADVRDAARLRSLAARLDQPLNRDQSFTGAQVAAMLRDGDT